ncbi:hypothetical protein DUI87_32700 [Hirundo rustica rustica]|uniref:NAD(P)(+)--arginine ADP-ribosyltransferase n=1 Tax=Hirundo rustica rustica TaxID=333673 RepID=A0A3M0IPL3_HIRRU|nr:hypothetical protein DUI87_32700 [Hirundo rustica rustica]
MAPLAHSLALLAMAVAAAAIDVVPLDMAWESFDDQYRGCGPAMTAALPALRLSEFQKNPLFTRLWVKAAAEWRKRGFRVSPLSSPAQAIAVMAYSSKDVHQQFNEAVRRAGRSPQEYRKNFHFKTLHFLLTQALLKLRQAQNPQCRNVFWGVPGTHFQARRGQRVRFGHFTSMFPRKEIAQKFGTDTIFQVVTCQGMDIRAFSMYPMKQEVLIPPYETFEVTQVIWDGKTTWIRLLSTGTYSKYNCEWLWKRPLDPLPPRKTRPGHHSTGSGHRGPLSHEATNVSDVTDVTDVIDVTDVTEATVANIITKTP